MLCAPPYYESLAPNLGDLHSLSVRATLVALLARHSGSMYSLACRPLGIILQSV